MLVALLLLPAWRALPDASAAGVNGFEVIAAASTLLSTAAMMLAFFGVDLDRK